MNEEERLVRLFDDPRSEVSIFDIPSEFPSFLGLLSLFCDPWSPWVLGASSEPLDACRFKSSERLGGAGTVSLALAVEALTLIDLADLVLADFTSVSDREVSGCSVFFGLVPFTFMIFLMFDRNASWLVDEDFRDFKSRKILYLG